VNKGMWTKMESPHVALRPRSEALAVFKLGTPPLSSATSSGRSSSSGSSASSSGRSRSSGSSASSSGRSSRRGASVRRGSLQQPPPGASIDKAGREREGGGSRAGMNEDVDSSSGRQQPQPAHVQSGMVLFSAGGLTHGVDLPGLSMILQVCVCVSVYVCMCVCVSVCRCCSVRGVSRTGWTCQDSA